MLKLFPQRPAKRFTIELTIIDSLPIRDVTTNHELIFYPSASWRIPKGIIRMCIKSRLAKRGVCFRVLNSGLPGQTINNQHCVKQAAFLYLFFSILILNEIGRASVGKEC